MAQMNASLADVETVFVPTSPEYSFLASSLVKEVAAFGGDVSGLVPDFVHDLLVARLAERRVSGRRDAVSRGAPPFCGGHASGRLRFSAICCARTPEVIP